MPEIAHEWARGSLPTACAREYMLMGGGGRSGSHDVARRSRGRSCLVALRGGCCDNDDAIFDSLPLLYLGGGCIAVIGEAEVVACRCRSRRRS